MTIEQAVSDFLGRPVSQWHFIAHKKNMPEIIKLEIELENGNIVNFIVNNQYYTVPEGEEELRDFEWPVFVVGGTYFIRTNSNIVNYLPDNTPLVNGMESLKITNIRCLTKKDVDIDDLITYYKYEGKPANVFGDTDFFQIHFGLKTEQNKPSFLSEEQMNMKLGHLSEEFNEILKAYKERDIVEVADGLMDLIYVAAGLANLMNLPCHELWKDVQNSNIAYKERVTSLDNATKRGSTFDVHKTKDWIAPRGKEIIEAAIARHNKGK